MLTIAIVLVVGTVRLLGASANNVEYLLWAIGKVHLQPRVGLNSWGSCCGMVGGKPVLWLRAVFSSLRWFTIGPGACLGLHPF